MALLRSSKSKPFPRANPRGGNNTRLIFPTRHAANTSEANFWGVARAVLV